VASTPYTSASKTVPLRILSARRCAGEWTGFKGDCLTGCPLRGSVQRTALLGPMAAYGRIRPDDARKAWLTASVADFSALPSSCTAPPLHPLSRPIADPLAAMPISLWRCR